MPVKKRPAAEKAKKKAEKKAKKKAEKKAKKEAKEKAKQKAQELALFWANVLPRWQERLAAEAAAGRPEPGAIAFSEWVNARASMQGVTDPWSSWT